MEDEILTEKVAGVTLQFKTKSGVFSKVGLDKGSRLLLEEVDFKKVPDRGLIADVGAGTGVIGFVAAKKVPSAHVHLMEVNMRAANLAKENLEINRLKNVEVFLSDLFSEVGKRSYNLILSNPAQHLGNEFLEEFADGCLSHLKPSGEVYWVVQGFLAPYVKRLFANVFGTYKIVSHSKEYLVIKAQKG